MSFLFRDETRELNDLTRREASGSFVQLSNGITHYELSNPLPAPLLPSSVEGRGGVRDVVLVHGFSTPYFIYDPTFQFLTQSGFRVLRYDLFGRGFSDRPYTRYNIDLFVKQLTELLDALRFTRPVSLVGLSMGGPITATFTARHPERVSKLTLIDPAGARLMLLSLMAEVAATPILGEIILSMVRSGRIIKNIATDLFDRRLVENFRANYLAQMQYKGFRRAILSTIRNHMLDSFLDFYKRVGQMDLPVLLFWGRNDTTVPFKHSHVLRAALPRAEFHVIENCGHIPHYEKPEEVNPILLNFLRR